MLATRPVKQRLPDNKQSKYGRAQPRRDTSAALASVDSNLDHDLSRPSTHNPAIILDSACTGNYFPPSHAHRLENITPTTTDNRIIIPDGSELLASHKGTLKGTHPALPLKARTAFLVPELEFPLMSLPVLADSDCNIALTKSKATVSFNNEVIITGTRNNPHVTEPLRQLWTLDLPTSKATTAPSNFMGNVIHHDNHAELVAFYHAALGSPAAPTYMEAVRRGYVNLTGLTVEKIRKNIPNPIATPMGHLNRTRSNLRSTKAQPSPEPTSIPNDVTIHETDFPSTPAVAENSVFLRLVKAKDFTYVNHVDAMGRFPISSQHGSCYLLLFYSEDANYIHVEAMKSRSTAEYIRAFRNGLTFFWASGFKPHVQRLDNEVSDDLLKVLKTEFNIVAELAAPTNHRALRAERAIQTYKNHFIATLCTLDPSFPLTLWEDLLPQIEMTLNIMRGSYVNPLISAYEQVMGPYDFNRHPFVPLGVPVIVYEKPKSQRASWDPHGVKGFYLGPAPLHYRCFNVWVPETNRVRVSDTLSWHPKQFHMPGSNPSEIVASAISDLIAALELVSAPLLPPPPGFDSLDISTIIPNLSQQLRYLQQLYACGVSSNESAPQLFPPTAPQLFPPTVPYLSPPPTLAQRVEHHFQHSTPSVDIEVPPPTTLHVAPAVQRVDVPNQEPVNVAPTITHIEPAPAASSTTMPIPASRRSTRSRKGHNPRYAMHTCAIFAKDGAVSTPSSDSPTSIPVIKTADLRTRTTPPPAVIPTLDYRLLIKGPDKVLWEAEQSKEFIRLVETTASMRFCAHSKKPDKYRVKYYKPVCSRKFAINGSPILRVRGTVADTHSCYDGPTYAATASSTTVNLLLNSTVSDDAEWMTADIVDYYLGTPMLTMEYMLIPLRYIPRSTQERYKLTQMDQSGTAMVEISKGMYGLAQAGRLAQDRLILHLAKHGYSQCTRTPCLFYHSERKTLFSLVVDDFGIKYFDVADREHLLNALRELYTITTDLKGTAYLGMHINYVRSDDANIRMIQISMPGATQAFLDKYQFVPKSQRTDAPAPYTSVKYGTHVIAPLPLDTSPPLDAARVVRAQSIIGSFQYYARAIDATQVCTISKLATSPKTEQTEANLDHFLNYAASWPDAIVTYRPSNMKLQVHSDASYLSETKGRSRVGGYHFLGDYDPNGSLPPNGFIETISTILDVVVSSALEAEAGGIFINAQHAVITRQTLEDMRHPQDDTLIVSDNYVGVNILNGNLPPKRSRAMDMRFYWVKDRIKQRQFKLTWLPGDVNLADYFTKTHSTPHYRSKRNTYVSDPLVP
jgi:hypothetical protein